MPAFYNFEKLSFYPHMFPRDIEVWERFIKHHPNYFVKVAYDVKVGTGAIVNQDVPKNIQEMQTELTKKRIDALGLEVNGVAAIVEVKPRAGLGALGQVRSYEVLFNIEYPDLVTRKIIICDDADPDIKTVALKDQIEIIII